MLNDLFRWLRDAILESTGRLIVSVFSLGFVRTQRDEDELTFPLYGVVRDADGKYVASSGIARLIGALVFAAAFIATFMLLSDIPI